MKMLLALLLAVSGVVALPPLDQSAPKNLLKPTNKIASWRFEETDGGKGEVRETDKEIVFKVNEVDSVEWHVQTCQVDLDLQEGKEYVVKFQAKSPERRSIVINAMVDQEDWHNIGLQEELYLSKEYSEFEFRFKAEQVVSKKNRITIILGNAKGEVYIKDMTLTAI